MKSSGHNTAVIFLILFATELFSGESKHSLMSDPFMAIHYDPEIVKFERCPKWILAQEDSGGFEPEQWMFAQCPQADDTLYIISGLVKYWDEATRKRIDSIQDPDFGVVIKTNGKKIKALGTPDGLFGKFAILQPNDGICLVDDAVERYIKAFGGPSELQKQIDAQGVDTFTVGDSAFVDELKKKGVIVPPEKKSK